MVWAILGSEILCVFGVLSLLIGFPTAGKPGSLRRRLFTKHAQDASTKEHPDYVNGQTPAAD
jgi:hypothetical protein